MSPTQGLIPARQWILLLILSSIPFAASVAQPRLLVVGGDTVNWGTIAPIVISHPVKIVNTGRDTLKVFNISTSCGCTAAPIDRSAIPSGDTATMMLSMIMHGHSGEQWKTVSFQSNDPRHPRVTLNLRANVFQDLEISPSALPVLRSLNIGESYTISLALENTGTTPLEIEPPRFVPGSDTVGGSPMLLRFDTNERRRIMPAEVIHLNIIIQPRMAGTLTGDVHIATTSDIIPEFKLPLYCSTLDYNAALRQASGAR